MNAQIVRDRRLEPVRPMHLAERRAFQPVIRVLFKPKVIAALFLVGGGIFGFVYGFLSI